MQNRKFTGTATAVITPFKTDFSVDYQALGKIIDHQLKGGLDFIVALGTTAEIPTLSQEEQIKIIDLFIEKIDGKIPLIVGAGGNDTAKIIKFISKVQQKNIDGFLSVVPYYNKVSQKGILQHFKAISAATEKDIMIYNVPARTSINMEAETTLELANECKNIVAVKEASGRFPQIMNIIDKRPENFSVVSGDDDLLVPTIALGADGVVSVSANAVPDKVKLLIDAALSNDFDLARKIQYQLHPLHKAIFSEGNPTGIKCLMHHLGFCENVLRLPCPQASKELNLTLKEIANLINE